MRDFAGGMGSGRVKLAFVAGAWLNWLMIPIAIQLAAFATLSGYSGLIGLGNGVGVRPIAQ
jgi:prepilin signal peptidase PulO-like enzyme (type II secretory pathway)